jgi:hypothetical protein
MWTYLIHGEPTPGVARLLEGVGRALEARGFRHSPEAEAPNLVLNAITEENPKPYRRRAQATFVASVLELPRFPEEPIKELYPYLVRALSNVLLAYVPGEGRPSSPWSWATTGRRRGRGFTSGWRSA